MSQDVVNFVDGIIEFLPRKLIRGQWCIESTSLHTFKDCSTFKACNTFDFKENVIRESMADQIDG